MALLIALGACSSARGRVCAERDARYAPPSSPEALTQLAGLSFSTFVDESYKEILLRDPEYLTELGFADDYGVGNDTLTNISDAYVRDTYALQAGILALLQTYDRSQLTKEQQTSYDVYSWYLDDARRQQELRYYDYPVMPVVTGTQNRLIYFFTDIHPVQNAQDADDYVTRLCQVESKLGQLIDGLNLREQAGVVPPRRVMERSLPDILRIANGDARAAPFYTAFRQKLDSLTGASETRKDTWLENAESAIDESVIPAFQALAQRLQQLESVAPANDGVWQFGGGDAYYAQALRHHTTTDLTPDEIHALGLQEIDRIHAEMRVLFDQLGYPTSENIPTLFGRVARDGGYVAGNAVVTAYESLISQAEQNLDPAFDVHPSAPWVVIGGPTGGYYVPASRDGSRPGAFYANATGVPIPRYGMPTLAYHEVIPGHHLQIALAQELSLPLFRSDVSFNAYAEGWALYAERLASELGWYDGDIYGDLGRLQAEAFRAARLVVDTGIHAKRWTFEQALEYMRDSVGAQPTVINLEYEVGRYVAWPGQATAYKIGMSKILDLRQQAIEQLGPRFDLKEFHRVVLLNGSVPLGVLETLVQDYIDAKLASEP